MNFVTEYLNNYFKDNSLENLTPLLDVLHEREYALRDVGIHPRVMHSWYTNNLLSFNEKSQHKHRFTFFEVIWIWIIEDLRKFGYPYKAIQKAREYLMTPFNLREFLEEAPLDELYSIMNEIYHIGPAYDSLTDVQIEHYKKSLFEADYSQLNKVFPGISILLMDFIYTRQDWVLLFDQDGGVRAGLREGYGMGQNEELFNNTYIILPIIRYFTRLASNPKYYVALGRVNFIGEKEQMLLEQLQQDNIQKVTFRFIGKPEHIIVKITKKKRIEAQARISDIISRGKYETIEIQTQDGSISYGSQTTKLKFDK